MHAVFGDRIASGAWRDIAGSVDSAKLYLTGALEAQLDLGHGSGPMDHAWKWR